jgi:hypothetical protein
MERKERYPILSPYLLIRSHSMFMLALVITIIIVDTLFRPHITIMAQLTGMGKRAGRKEYKEKDREDGGRMVKRRWRGRRDTRGIK